MAKFNPVVILFWLVPSLITAGLGWLVVRFLPLWASIPLMIVGTLMMTLIGVFLMIAALPGETEAIKRVRMVYSWLLALATLTPTMVAINLYRWVG